MEKDRTNQGDQQKADRIDMRDIGIGVLGFGTIGTGVVKGLLENGDLLAERLGARPVIRRIADVDLETDRGLDIDKSILTNDAASIVNDPEVDIVVELIGGTGIARDLVLKSLEAGKPVVTANKALLAKHGKEIVKLAMEKNVDIYFGASVGGGIPIISALREGLVANRVESIHAILNGTCNYILTKMEEEGMAFDVALKQAQDAGFAEADPTLDIEGFDTAHKAAILASLAFGMEIPLDSLHVEGITGVTDIDMKYALEAGYRIKLLAVIKDCGDGLEVRVHPALVPLTHVLASVRGVYNAVMVRGDMVKTSLFYGRGAGMEPTASTVLGDVADVIRNIVSDSPCRVPAVALLAESPVLKDMQDIKARYYVRLSLKDEAGVVAKYADILGKYDISIASLMQKEGGEGEFVPVVLVTHETLEKNMTAALSEINQLSAVGADSVMLRIEEQE